MTADRSGRAIEVKVCERALSPNGGTMLANPLIPTRKEMQMADDPNKRGMADRSRQSKQEHEVRYQARKEAKLGSSSESRQAKAGSRSARSSTSRSR